MLKKSDVVFDFYQGSEIKSLECEGLEFRIYLKNVDGIKKYEIEFFAPLDVSVSLDKITDLNARVEKIIMKKKTTQETIKELIIDDFPSFAIVASEQLAINQTLCFAAKEIN